MLLAGVAASRHVAVPTELDLLPHHGVNVCDYVQVWPKAVDCVRFHPEHACQEMRRRLESDHSGHSSSDSSSSSSKGPLLLYVGRVSSEKNLELLRGVLERVPGARLAIVGDGPAMEVRTAGRGLFATASLRRQLSWECWLQWLHQERSTGTAAQGTAALLHSCDADQHGIAPPCTHCCSG